MRASTNAEPICPSTRLLRFSLGKNRFSLDFDQHGGIDQPAHRHQRRCGRCGRLRRARVPPLASERYPSGTSACARHPQIRRLPSARRCCAAPGPLVHRITVVRRSGPSRPVAVVPETWTTRPTRTAREYPTTGSHGAPLVMFCRFIVLRGREREPRSSDVRWRAGRLRFGDTLVGSRDDLFNARAG